MEGGLIGKRGFSRRRNEDTRVNMIKTNRLSEKILGYKGK